MRYNYKIIPLKSDRHPAFPDSDSTWAPMLGVRLSVGHGRQAPRIEALIDSGADSCIFHASIFHALQLKLEDGVHGLVGGSAGGVRIDAFYHDVNLWVGAGALRIRVGFSKQIPIAGLLGRRGFFDNHIITFDPSADPPGFDLQRLGRA